MKMFIPPLKTRLEVNKSWTVYLHNEYRNRSLWDELPDTKTVTRTEHMIEHCRKTVAKVVILSGSRLTVSRIFIRKGQEFYDSVTLSGMVWISPTDDPITCRFWVTLDDFNTLNATVIKDGN